MAAGRVVHPAVAAPEDCQEAAAPTVPPTWEGEVAAVVLEDQGAALPLCAALAPDPRASPSHPHASPSPSTTTTPPGPEGPDRSAGMWSPCHPPLQSLPSNPFSDTTTNGELLASEVPKMRMLDNPHGSNSNNSNRSSGSMEGRQGLGGFEETQKHQTAGIPQMAVAPLNLPQKKTRIGTVAPLISPQSPGGGGKEAFVPSSPAHKGNVFWAMVPATPPSHTSRPGSFSYPSDGGGDSLGRGSHGTPSHHRHSTHSKDIDRMSTCSSTSEQSIQSTQSNGVRCQVEAQASARPGATH